MCSKATRISDEEIRELQERAQALARESEDLRLASELIARLGDCVGVEDTMARLARLTLEAVCGARAAVWWRADGTLLCVDALGDVRTPERIDSSVAGAVFDGGRAVERSSEGHAALVSWGVPLVVAGAVAGVLEVDDASASLQDAMDRLRTFFDAATAMIATEAQATSECSRTCDDLREANERLAVEVDECRQSRDDAADSAAVDVEGLIARRTRALKTLARVTETLVRAYDERELLQNVCDTVVDTGGYALCWVGFVEHDKHKTVRPVASAGKDPDYVDHIQVSWGTGRHGRGPSGKSIRRRKPVRVRDMLADPNYLPWRDEALRRGYRSSASFPLIDSAGEVFGTIAVYSGQPDAFGDEDMQLLNELARDLAFGIGAVRERKARAEAEKQVREAARYARSLVEVNTNPLVLISPEGKIADVNRATEVAIGIPRSQLIGTDFSAYFTNPTAAQQGYEKALAEGGVSDYPLTIKSASGQLIDVEYNAAVYRSEMGELLGVFASARDVTQSRRDQAQAAQLAAIVSSSQDAIFTQNLNHVVTSWNDAAQELYGYSAEEMVGQDIERVSPLEKRGEARALADRVCQGERIVDFVTQHLRKDGSLVDVSLTLSPIADDAGGIVGVSGIARDITYRVRAEAERVNHLRLVESLDRVNLAIQGTDDLDLMMKNVLDVIRDIFGSDRAFLVFPCDPNADAWTVQMESTAPEYPGAMGLTVPMADDIVQLHTELLASSVPLRYGPGNELPLPGPTSERFGFRSMMSIALRPRMGPPWHFGLHQCAYARAWTDPEADLLQEIARRLGDALSLLLSHRELERSEAAYRRIIETANEGIVARDAEGILTYVNSRMAEMLGYSVEETVGRPITDFLFAEDLAEAPAAIDRRRQGLSEEFDSRARHKDGRTMWFHISATPILDEAGEFAGSFGMVTDITEAKRADEERAGRLQFAESMDRVNRAIQGAEDLDTMMSDVLDVALSVFGCDRAFLLYPCDPNSPSWAVPMERTVPEYPGVLELGLEVPTSADVAGTFQALLEADGAVRFDPDSDHPLPADASERFGFKSLLSVALRPRVGKSWQFGLHQCSYARVWTSGEVAIAEGIAHRLEDALGTLLASRELQRSETEYRRLVETATEGVARLDAEGVVTFCNARWVEMLGYTVEEIVGRKLEDFVISDEVADHDEKMAHRRQGEAEEYERRFQHKDGHAVWAHVSATPVFDEFGGFAGSFGMITDITEAKRADEERAERLKLAESMDRVNRAIQGTDDLEQMMSDVLDIVLSVFESDRAFLMYPCDPEASTWTVPMERYRPGYPGVEALGIELPMDADVAATLRLLLEADGPVRFGPGTDHPLPEDVSERFGFRSFMSMALRPRIGGAWQFGVHQCTHAREWTDAEVGLLAEIGRRLEDGLGSMIARRNLVASEGRYRRLVETASEGIMLLSPDAVTTFVNARMGEMLGFTPEEMVGQPLASFFFEEDLADHAMRMERRRQGISEEYDRRFRRKDGREVWTHISAAPLLDDEGRVVGMLGMMTDISERKRAEDELAARLRLAESMDRVNRAIQGTDDLDQMMSDVLDVALSVFECDRAFLLYPCDPESASWTVSMERARPEYRGTTALGTVLPTTPDVAGVFRILLDADGAVAFGPGAEHPVPPSTSERFGYQSMLSSVLRPKIGKPWEFGLHQCSHAREWTDAERVLLQEIGRRLEDGLTGMLASRDLRRSEAEYRRLIETSAEGIWAVGPDWSTTFVNPRMAEILGYSTDEMTQGPATRFAYEEDLPEYRRVIARLREGSSEVLEVRMRTKDGRTVWLSVSIAPMIDDSGEFAGAFGMATDITARKEAEDDLRRRNEELERFERVVVGRELRMQELKGRIAELEQALAEARDGDRHG